MKKRLILFNVISNFLTLSLMLCLGFFVTRSNYDEITQRKVKDVASIYCANYSSDLVLPEDGIRVTIIDYAGNVLKDNEAEVGETNHLDREEIVAAKEGHPSIVVRYSESMQREMMYYAELLENDGSPVYIRVAVPMESINQYLLKSIAPMILILALVWAASIVASVLLSHFLLRPLLEVKKSLQDIKHSQYKGISYEGSDKSVNAILKDIDGLAKEINDGNLIRQEFFANASHELKTPLTTIKGFNELIVLQNDDPAISDYASRALKESDRVISLIGDMLDLSQIETSSLDKSTLTPVNIRPVAEEVKTLLEPLINEKNITFSVEGEGVILMEKRHLFALLKNLCENAVKYNNDGGRVEVKLTKEQSKMVIAVIDDGIGIAKEDQKRVFERFYRVDKSRSRETGGTGLGLSIVKHIVEFYEAEIALKSAPGKGTTVEIRL